MNQITLEILRIVVALASVVITYYLIPLIKSKMSNEKLAEVEKWASFIVLALQQTYGTEEEVNEIKKKKAMELINDLIKNADLSITPEQINIIIESAVKNMKLLEAQVPDFTVTELPDIENKSEVE